MTQPRPTVRRYYLACLAARTAALAALAAWAVLWPDRLLADLHAGLSRFSGVTALWLLLLGSMALRLLPLRMESLGCRKASASCFCPTGRQPDPREVRQADRRALAVALLWAAVNGVFFLGYGLGWYGEAFLLCLAGFYGVCDIVCILFFCPFQAWLMGNRCCTTCRIYDWDYLMLCTPLLALRGFYARSACLLAAALALRWEVLYRRHPERFFESGNEALQCGRCHEQLCRYKRGPAAKGRAGGGG